MNSTPMLTPTATAATAAAATATAATAATATATARATRWTPEGVGLATVTATQGAKAAARGGVDGATGWGRGQGLHGVADAWLTAMRTDEQATGKEAAAAGAIEAGCLLMTRQR